MLINPVFVSLLLWLPQVCADVSDLELEVQFIEWKNDKSARAPDEVLLTYEVPANAKSLASMKVSLGRGNAFSTRTTVPELALELSGKIRRDATGVVLDLTAAHITPADRDRLRTDLTLHTTLVLKWDEPMCQGGFTSDGNNRGIVVTVKRRLPSQSSLSTNN